MPLSHLLAFLVRVLVGARGAWIGCAPAPGLRIYYANHTSHLDTLALWSALPGPLRARTRPVAAQDYWNRAGLRKYLATHAFNALFIDRSADNRDRDPLAPLAEALARGESLILFPEGTRRGDALPGPFKSGLFHLAERAPQAELVPVYLENLYRSMPKGALLPVPLTCSVRFGSPLARRAGESRQEFLARARQAVVDLA
ncbi:MAG TPA: lysophospholipid acyltransferase family protein [Rudaea sp.]|nr:lysophospholipid acyltransferase family protein [Rudaea sp.]